MKKMLETLLEFENLTCQLINLINPSYIKLKSQFETPNQINKLSSDKNKETKFTNKHAATQINLISLWHQLYTD